MLEKSCCWWSVDVREVVLLMVDVEEVVLSLEEQCCWCLVDVREGVLLMVSGCWENGVVVGQWIM